MELAPICLFGYNRINEITQTIDSLQKNFLAKESDLYIFIDGPKHPTDYEKTKTVVEYVKNIYGFKNIIINASDKNKGLANSIISGVSQIVEKHGKVIVLEDDLITSPNFLDFMNQALDYYEVNFNIHSISGYTLNLKSLKYNTNDFYIGYRASSWGWGTWNDRWKSTDWKVMNYHDFKWNPIQQLKFMRGGSDMPGMLKNQMNGRIDSWAIRWCYDQFLKNQFTIFPTKSKVYNIGVGLNATHTKNIRRFKTKIDISTQRKFIFNNNLKLEKKLLMEFRYKFSIISRLLDKLI